MIATNKRIPPSPRPHRANPSPTAAHSAAGLLCLHLFLVPTATLQAQFLLATNSDNTLTITAYTGAGGAVMIPGTNYGRPVTVIGPSAFCNCWALTSVTIPDTVTAIGHDAFA